MLLASWFCAMCCLVLAAATCMQRLATPRAWKGQVLGVVVLRVLLKVSEKCWCLYIHLGMLMLLWC